MSKADFDNLLRQYELIEADKALRVSYLKMLPALDEDGYPTESALEAIAKWPARDNVGWFEFIRSIWYMADWGWSERVEAAMDEQSDRQWYNISTAGWSGNESVIAAMKNNTQQWHMTWYSSRRGGHYEFCYSTEDNK